MQEIKMHTTLSKDVIFSKDDILGVTKIIHSLFLKTRPDCRKYK